MVAFREVIELSIAVLITGIVVGFIAYAGAHDRFAIKLSSPSQTCPLSLEPDYAVGCSWNTTALLSMQLPMTATAAPASRWGENNTNCANGITHMG